MQESKPGSPGPTVLSVDVDAPVGDESARARAKRRPVPTLARHMERIGSMPKRRQKFVIQVMESVHAHQAAHRTLAEGVDGLSA